MSNTSNTSLLPEIIPPSQQYQHFQAQPLKEIHMMDAMALALRYVVAFMHSFPKQDRTRPMLIWNKSLQEHIDDHILSPSEEFARDLVHNNAKIGLVPDNDKDEWTIDNINSILTLLAKNFQLSDMQMDNGMGCVNLKLWDNLVPEKTQLLSGQITVKFLKKVPSKQDTKLVDDERLTIRVNKCVRAKLFTFFFLKPGRLLSIARTKKPPKQKNPRGRPRHDDKKYAKDSSLNNK